MDQAPAGTGAAHGAQDATDDALALWDYRRRVEALYAAARRAGAGADAWRRWREGRDELFGRHPQSALPAERREGFGGLAYFSHDPAWRVEGEVAPLAAEVVPATRAVPHSGDGTTPLRPVGLVRATTPSGDVELVLWWLDAYGGGVFLPFGDATNGGATYGGGRYLLDTVKGADLGHEGRRVVLDFNYAYHPSCVHDARWSCPLAPPENRLAVAVPAGERLGDEGDAGSG